MRIAIFSTKPYEKKYLEATNKGKHELVFLEESLSSSTTELAIGAKAVCIFTNDDASANVLTSLKALGVDFLAVRATGHDNVDSLHAGKIGIKVANVPEYSPYAIAEHSVGLMLALNRKLVQADQKVKTHDFRLDTLIGFDFNGKKVGIIGCGKIGAIVARIMYGFSCSLLIYDPKPNPYLIEKYMATYVDMDTLVKESDIISIHVPLNNDTKYLIRKELIAKMKKGVMVINTGRGAVIDTKAAIEGLKTGQIGSLGLDVYEYEKGLFFYDHSNKILQDDLFARLLTFKNVLVTGHQAFLTETALQNIADTTIINFDSWSQGFNSPHEL